MGIVIGRSVCLQKMSVSAAKTTKPIEIPFEMWFERWAKGTTY